ncbi:MAG: phosphatase PAP2 family protein [Lachnospiraceae bacterium]|nr:phosphatase PAP2 family protein [Lachnospiraceae bacterium]
MSWLQQTVGAGGAKIAEFFTMFGEEVILIVMIGFFYWGVNKQVGVRVGLTVAMGCVWNPMIKNIFCRRRPYFDSESIKCLKPVEADADIYDITAQGYSFPSGHSSQSMAAYGTLAMLFKKRWLYIVAGLIIFAVGCSRVFLGVHYPTDVLCGWLLGLFCIVAVSLILRVVKKKPLVYLILVLTAVPGLFYCKTNDYFSAMGLLFAIVLANLFEERFVNFKPTKNPVRVVLRLAGGLAVYVVLNTLVKLPFSEEFLESQSAAQFAFRTIRYTVIMFIDFAIYPMIFDKFGKDKQEVA